MNHDRKRTYVPISLASSGGVRQVGVEGEQHRRFFALASPAVEPAFGTAH